MKLTEKEIKILNGMRENEYNDALANDEGEYDFIKHCGTWTFTAIDNSGLDAKIARGVISSLIKKGLVIANTVSNKARYNDEDTIEFTRAGAELFRNADGEKCSWGGPNLLNEKVTTNKETALVTYQGKKVYSSSKGFFIRIKDEDGRKKRLYI